jgi:uroporphyrinogen decarboxylase
MRAQIEAGVQAVQIFDSWVGQLSRADYAEFALPHTRRIFETLAGSGVPDDPLSACTPARSCPTWRRRAGRDRRRLARALDEAWDRLGHDHAIQGNLDPVRLLGPADGMFAGGRTTSCAAPPAVPGHIFNLGHGILPSTSLAQVQELARHVHGFRL